MSDQLRIACIGARGIPASYSGIERACESLYAGLAERGHQVTMYCRSEYVSRCGQHHKGIALRSASSIRTKSFETLSHVGCSLAHALTVGHYDLIHLHALAPNLFSRLCRLRGIPTVATVQGLDWQRAKWRGVGATALEFAERSMVANVDSIIVVSRALQQYFQERYNRSTHYIPNGVDVSCVTDPVDETVLQQHDLTKKEYVLFLARLVPEKRVQDLILAFRDVNTRFKLAIAGESSHTNAYVNTLRQLAAQESRVVFTGFQQHPAVRALFRNAAVYVLPSEMEGLPLSLLECVAEGTPAVVSDIPPHREVFADARGYDLFFTPGDVAGLSAALRRALSNLRHYQQVAAEARGHARLRYSWPSIIDRTESVFQEVWRDATERVPALGGRAA